MKNIKTYLQLALLCFAAFFAASCEKLFLEKPAGSDLTVDSIFATSRSALGPIASSYARTLAVGFPAYQWVLWANPAYKDPIQELPNGGYQYGLLHGTIMDIADETQFNESYAYSYLIISGGMTQDMGGGQNLTEDGWYFHWVAIRFCYLTMENIDLVADMSDLEKEQVKAEMKALIAYRYEEMLKRYGGVPIVTKALMATDDIKIPRSSVDEVIKFIVGLCDEAAAVLPNSYPENMKGRATKGFALAVKAETYMFAARPLFNSASPYLSLGGENDKLICYGSYEASRWEDAINANLDLLNWAASNGYYLINTGKPLEDFGIATSEPGNPEIIMSDKFQYATLPQKDVAWNQGLFLWLNPHGGKGDYGCNVSLTCKMLEQFYKEDGTDQTWAGTDSMPFMDYYTKCDEMEPRFKASVAKIAGDALNNPNDPYWSKEQIAVDQKLGNQGCGLKIKFWANAGKRQWFEWPIYRLAEFYLNLAEAYNEVGKTSEALNNLNTIRKRAGIPDVTETDKVLLRKIIQREWAVEFFEESHRLYDIKHWKIAPEIMGVPRYVFKYSYVAGPAGPAKLPEHFDKYWKASYINGFWAPSQYLCPFPGLEVNKGYLVQNPGY
jgi:hypothetical protein